MLYLANNLLPLLLQITLGRCTKDASVDVDLKLEGPAWKISRRQVGGFGGKIEKWRHIQKYLFSGHHQTVEQRRVLHRQRGPEVHIRRRETGELAVLQNLALIIYSGASCLSQQYFV